MKKKIIIFVSILVALTLFLGSIGYIGHTHLNSPRFQKEIISELSRQFDCKIQVDQMKVLGRKGILKGIHVTHPDIRPQDFLEIEKLRFHFGIYDALFNQKVVPIDLKLNKPQIQIDLSDPVLSEPTSSIAVPSDAYSKIPPQTNSPDSKPNLKTEKVEGAISSAPLPPKKLIQKRRESPSDFNWPSPPSFNLKEFIVEEGSLSLILPLREKITFKNIGLQSSFSTIPSPTSAGTISWELARILDRFDLTNAKINFLWQENSLVIPKWSLSLFGGSLNGKFKAESSKDFPFDLQIHVEDLNIRGFSAWIHLPEGEVQGKIHSDIRLQGSLQRPLLAQGEGQVRLQDARLIDFPALKFLAGYLSRPDLRNLPLEKCELDFVLQAKKTQISRIEVSSRDIQLGGNGWINLSNSTQEFQMKLTLSKEIVNRFPPSVTEGLERRSNGSIEFPFRTWGSLDRPQNDLQNRFQAIAARAIGGSIFDSIFESVPRK